MTTVGACLPPRGIGGYEREANYHYVPLGIDFDSRVQKSLSLRLNLEYDLFLSGLQKSHLDDGDPDFETLTNHQGKGWRFRTSLRVLWKTKYSDLFFEPFVRHWFIAGSEISPVISDGVVSYEIEPENNSREYGLKLGLNF